MSDSENGNITMARIYHLESMIITTTTINTTAISPSETEFLDKEFFGFALLYWFFIAGGIIILIVLCLAIICIKRRNR